MRDMRMERLVRQLSRRCLRPGYGKRISARRPAGMLTLWQAIGPASGRPRSAASGSSLSLDPLGPLDGAMGHPSGLRLQLPPLLFALLLLSPPHDPIPVFPGHTLVFSLLVALPRLFTWLAFSKILNKLSFCFSSVVV